MSAGKMRDTACGIRHATGDMGQARRATGDATGDMGDATRDMRHGRRDMGHGTRDTRHASREMGNVLLIVHLRQKVLPEVGALLTTAKRIQRGAMHRALP